MSTTTSQLVIQTDLQQFFANISSLITIAENEQRRRDREESHRFNVFDLFVPDENKLSKVLAFLLNPQGKHGQGHDFLQLFFQQLGWAVDVQRLPTAKIWLEASTHLILNSRRRMDVLVDAGTFVAIENKVDALEQEEQVKDYLEQLRLLCTKDSQKKSLLIYLTPNGRRPQSLDRAAFDEATANGRLCCWSYQTHLRKWLESCREKCEARRMKEFLTDFIAYIESGLRRDLETNTEEDKTNEK